jgi:hypothetical protein
MCSTSLYSGFIRSNICAVQVVGHLGNPSKSFDEVAAETSWLRQKKGRFAVAVATFSADAAS